jgi:hypothetical protein
LVQTLTKFETLRITTTAPKTTITETQTVTSTVQGFPETKPTPYVVLEAFLQLACRLNSQRGLSNAQMTLEAGERNNIDNVIRQSRDF